MEPSRLAWRMSSSLLSLPTRAATSTTARSPLQWHIFSPISRRPFSELRLPTQRATPRLVGRPQPQPRIRQVRARRYNSTQQSKPQSPDPTPSLGSPAGTPSLSQRLKQLSREYGWSAVGVYFTLSALDFPFFFLGVKWLGTERIGDWEHVIVQGVKDIISIPFPSLFEKTEEQEVREEKEREEEERRREAEAEEGKKHEGGATIWTQLALAYALHKSFIFLRVPLTAAVTPKVVKTLRGWGWNIGKRTPKTA